MIISSPTQDILPYRNWPNTQVSDGSTTYTYGPSGLGTPLKSGQYFGYKWAAIISNGVPKIAQIGNDAVITNITTGYNIDNFESNLEYKNISLGFDSSGNFLLGLQFQESVRLWYQSGSVLNTYAWAGAYPTLFNSVQVNLPRQIPPLLYPRWNTGNIYCFYQNNSNLNYRLLSDNFSIEYTGNADLSFFSGSTQIVTIEQPEQNSEDPYRFVRIQPSANGEKVKTLTSQSYSPWALISFENIADGLVNEFGVTGKLSYDYGNWKKNGLIGKSSGYILNFSNFLLDNYESERVGEAENNLNFNMYRPALTTGFTRNIFVVDFYAKLYDTFSDYPLQENINNFQKNIVFISGSYQPSVRGQSFILGNSFYDSFANYNTGKIKYLRKVVYSNAGGAYGNIFRLY